MSNTYPRAFKLTTGEEIIALVTEDAEDGWFIAKPRKYITSLATGFGRRHAVYEWGDWINNLPYGRIMFLEKKLVIWSDEPIPGQYTSYILNLKDEDKYRE